MKISSGGSVKTTIKTIILVTATLSMLFFIKATDFQQVSALLKQFGFSFLYLILITFIAYFFATVGWHYCLGKPGGNIPITDLFLIRHLGEMFSIINPASVIGGEAVKVYLLEEKGLKGTAVLASILTSRVLMAATQLLLFFVTLPLMLFYDGRFNIQPTELTGFLTGILIIAAALVICFKKRSATKRLIARFTKGSLVSSLSRKLKFRQVLTEFMIFFKTDNQGVMLCLLFFTAHWIAGAMEIYLILKFLGISVSVVQVVFMDMGIIVFKALGTFVPGQIGVEEFANKIMLEFIGIPGSDVWLTVSILRRSRQLFWILFAVIIYFLFNKRIKAIPPR